MIFKKKNKSVVQFFTAQEQVLVRAPITEAKETPPEWWKKLPGYVDFHTDKLPPNAIEEICLMLCQQSIRVFLVKQLKFVLV